MKILVKVSYPSDELTEIEILVDKKHWYREVFPRHAGTDVGIPITEHFLGIQIDPHL